MFGRRYFSWRMITEAMEADRRNGEQKDLAERRNLCQINRISDRKFVQLYRLTKSAFRYLCDILRQNTDLKSSQRVSLETKVYCALLFYANGDYQRVVGVAHSLSQEAISQYVHQVTEALNHPNIVKQWIKFPSSLEARQQMKKNFYNMYGFPDILGCIDGSHFRIVKPGRNEEHLYYCRKHYHSLNVLVVSDHQGRITAINPKFGGASHDAFVWENSSLKCFMQTLHQNGETSWLLGDSGFPQRPWLMTPYINPISGSAEETYNLLHGKTRVIIENTFGRLKNRWRCLCKDRVLHYKPAKCAKIIIACAVLHNIALDFKVPLPEPRERNMFVYQETNGLAVTQDDDELSLLALGRNLRDRLAIRLHEANFL